MGKVASAMYDLLSYPSLVDKTSEVVSGNKGTRKRERGYCVI